MPSSLLPVRLGSNPRNSLSGILDYNTLKQYNRENLCSIYVSTQESLAVEGIIDTDRTSKFGVTATYKPLVDQSRWLDKIQDPVNLGSAAWDQPQVMIHSLRLSEESFKGFQAKNDFGVSMKVPVMCESDDPASLAYTVLKFACGLRFNGAAPAEYLGNGDQKIRAFGKDASSEFLLYAPNKYRIVYQGGTGGRQDYPENATTIAVGSRFLYTNCVVTDANAEFSDIVYHDGKPTWLQLNIQFKYWRQIDLSVLQDFLRVNTQRKIWGI